MRLEGNFADFESDDSKSKPRKEKRSIKIAKNAQR